MVRLVAKLFAKKDESPVLDEQVLVQDIDDREAGQAAGGFCFPWLPWCA